MKADHVAIVTMGGSSMCHPACFVFAGYADAEAQKHRLKEKYQGAYVELRVLPLVPDSTKK